MNISNILTVDANEAKKIIKDAYKKHLMWVSGELKNKPRALCIEGHSGIGKTDILKQVADELSQDPEIKKHCNQKIQTKIMNFQYIDKPELQGPQYMKDGVAYYAHPPLLPKDGFGLYVIDEYNRVNRDIANGYLTLIQDRNINGHELGSFWMIVLLGNHRNENDENDSVDVRYFIRPNDAAMEQRIRKIHLRGDHVCLLNYLEKKYGECELVRFLKMNPNFVQYDGTGVSPRAFESCINLLGPSDIRSDISFLNLCSEFGIQGAAVVKSWLENNSYPTFDDILVGKKTAFEYISNNQDRNDFFNSINTEIIRLIAKGAKPEQKQIENLKKYLDSLKSEHLVSIIAESLKRNVAMNLIQWLMNDAKYTKFIQNVLVK